MNDIPSPHRYRKLLKEMVDENRYLIPHTLLDEIGLESYYRHLLRSNTDCPPSLHDEVINFTLDRAARHAQLHIKGFRQTPENFLNRQRARRNERPRFICNCGDHITYPFEHMDGFVTWHQFINTSPAGAD